MLCSAKEIHLKCDNDTKWKNKNWYRTRYKILQTNMQAVALHILQAFRKQNLLGTQASSAVGQEQGTQFFYQVYLDAAEQDLEYLPG